MSVWLVAIEKEQALPWASFYLGEGMAERVMLESSSPLHGSGPVQNHHRMDHYPITVEQATVLLALLESEDALYEDHEADEAKRFVGGMSEEEFVLYVEVSHGR